MVLSLKKRFLMEPNKKRCSDINTGCTFLETFFKFIYISVCKQGYLRRNHALLIYADFHIHLITDHDLESQFLLRDVHYHHLNTEYHEFL